MAIAGKRYSYMTGPWSAPLSAGVQALIEFNGYVINDRYQSDRVRITSITGLDGADITDVREVVPGDEGEFAYQGLRRGDTIVMTGAIQAGSLATCTAMARDLRAAYAPLVESELKFRWFDVYDGFTDPQTWQNYTNVIGTYANLYGLKIGGGLLIWNVTNPFMITRSADNRLWGDVQVTERIIPGGFEDLTSMGVVLAVTDDNDYLRVRFYDSHQLIIETVVGGTAHALSTLVTGTAIAQGQPVWLRGRREGDLVTAELWLSEPTDTAVPDSSTQAWLSGSDADSFGDQVLSEVGMYGDATNTNWAITDFWVQSLYPGDIAFDAKTISKPSIGEAQQKKTIFERPVQLTLRTSWPYYRGAHQKRSQTLVPSSGNTTQLGFSSPLTNPLSALTIVPGSVSLENNILFLDNRGTAPERPILVMYGANQNFAIYNLVNGMQLSWSGDLTDGSYLVFDCMNRTLVDQNGADQKAYLSYSDPRWMILEPGWNDLYVVGSGYSSNTKMIAFYHDRGV